MTEDDGYEVAVFTEAVKVPRPQRAAFLNKACGKDEDLRRKVEALLTAHDHVGNFLEEPPTGGATNENN
jgi:eukaryotic-like serine/threonine-protein kinase